MIDHAHDDPHPHDWTTFGIGYSEHLDLWWEAQRCTCLVERAVMLPDVPDIPAAPRRGA